MQNSIISGSYTHNSYQCNKNQSLSFKWSCLKLFYFTALQNDHYNVNKAQQHCMKDCKKCW